MDSPLGAFALVLHSHLPYVLSHDRLEEEWLFEAAAESYLPLLQAFDRLRLHGVLPKVTLGVTPVLLDQLADPRFAPGFLSYLEQKAGGAREDQRIFRRSEAPYLAQLARLWETFYRRTAAFFTEALSANLVRALRRLQEQGQIELLASAATHAYLPLLSLDVSVRAQIALGVKTYRRYFKAAPQGFWLPECAYRPSSRWMPAIEGVNQVQPTERIGIDRWLSDAGLQYFLVDARQLQSSPPAYTRHSPCYPYWVDGNGAPLPAPLALFARDFEATAHVWQHDAGYPGDPAYLEFHKKQNDSGLRYWRITDRRLALDQKQPYVPEWALAQVSAQAAHFVQVLRARLREHRQRTGEPGVVVAAFDTELFGHWWFEGPQWIYELLRQLATSDDIALTTCSEYLRQYPPQHPVQLRESSWGAGGDHRVWRQPGAQQLWRNVYQAEHDLQRLGTLVKDNSRDKRLSRLLRQCGRELLLLQASDWPFMIGTGSTADHAQQRATLHYDNFQQCRGMVEHCLAGETLQETEWQWLSELEQQDALFPALDVRLFRDEND